MTDEPKITFAELNLDPRIQTAIDAAGYEHPTPIQEQAIPVIKKGGDVTGIAAGGSHTIFLKIDEFLNKQEFL